MKKSRPAPGTALRTALVLELAPKSPAAPKANEPVSAAARPTGKARGQPATRSSAPTARPSRFHMGVTSVREVRPACVAFLPLATMTPEGAGYDPAHTGSDPPDRRA